MTNTMKRKSAAFFLAAVCALPLGAMADGPTSRPTAHPGTDRPVDRIGERVDRTGRPNRLNPPRAPLTDEQWSQVVAFMEEYSPRRTAEFRSMSASSDERRVSFLKQVIAAQYDYVMSLKAEDSELYDLQLQKIKTQDDIYGMLRDQKKNVPMSEDQKKEFKELVVKLVDVNLGERERRIVRARESLARAQTTLEEDRKHKDSMVADRMEQFLREGIRPFKMDGDKPERRSPDEPGAMKDKSLQDTLSVAAPSNEPDAALLAR